MNKSLIAVMCLSLIAVLPACRHWRCCEKNEERREESGCRSCHEHKHGVGCEDGHCGERREGCRSCRPHVGESKVKPDAQRDWDHDYVDGYESQYN